MTEILVFPQAVQPVGFEPGQTLASSVKEVSKSKAPGLYPPGASLNSINPPAYALAAALNPFTATLSRDLYRFPVFSSSTPLLIARSIAESVG
jgi:hypothetical protein